MKHDDEIRGRFLDLALLRRFVPLLRPYRRGAITGFALLPAISLVRTLEPLCLQRAIDNSLLPGRLDLLWPIAALLIALLLAEAVLVFSQSWCVQVVGQRVMADLRRDSFAKLSRLPQRWFDWQPSGRLVTRLTNDVEQVGDLFGSGIVSAFGDVLTMVLVLSVMLSLHVGLTLVAFAVAPLLLGVLLLLRRPMRSLMRRLRAQTAGLNGFVGERVNGMAEVQIFGQEQSSAEQFEALQQDYLSAALSWVRWETLFYASVHLFGSLAVAAIIWQGGAQVLGSHISFGTLVAFIEYARKFFMPLTELAAKFSVLQTSNAALERIFALLDEREEAAGMLSLPSGPGRVAFEAVHFAYQPSEPVVRGLSLEVAGGECVALVGETGCGKTTLAQLLLGFYRPDSGRVLVNGIEVQQLTRESLSAQLGWVAQEPFLFHGSIRQNLDADGRYRNDQLWAALERSGARTLVERLGGLDVAAIDSRGRNLSSGERQLLSLARALVKQPQVLILDEATSHLDSDSERRIYQALQGLSGQCTRLLIIHHLALAARLADRILVLHRGQLCEQGSHQQLLAQGGRYARLWAIQTLQQDREKGNA
ncbi:MAG: ABC transporter ATP-binding protein [Desulfuromonadaceae bacterium]|nr:ABC transporter ATP-binding protein [Desulfuromonadaceae bacterium]